MSKVNVCGKDFSGSEVFRRDGLVQLRHVVSKDNKIIGDVPVTLFDTVDAAKKTLTSKEVYDLNRQRVQDACNLFRASYGKPAPLLTKEQREAIKGLSAEKKAAFEKKMADMLKEYGI